MTQEPGKLVLVEPSIARDGLTIECSAGVLGSVLPEVDGRGIT